MNRLLFLKYDSVLFSFPVGKLTITNNDLINFNLCNSYKLVYIYSNKLLSPDNQNNKISFFDVKLTFTKIINYDFGKITPFDPKKYSYSELLDLVYLSGKYSRFKRDNNIKDEIFQKLYKQWIDNCILNNDSIVIIREIHNKIVGFVTVEKVSANTCKIGLISVHPYFQGKGVGLSLINDASIYGYNSNYKIITVDTQQLNIPAINLYEKADFVLKNKTFIYHYWNYDTF